MSAERQSVSCGSVLASPRGSPHPAAWPRGAGLGQSGLAGKAGPTGNVLPPCSPAEEAGVREVACPRQLALLK